MIVSGDIVFFRSFSRTLEQPWKWIEIAFAICWGLAVVAGTTRGSLASARDQRWVPARLRAVVGPPREVGYREPATQLPAVLDRDAPACTAAQLSNALREIGCSATTHRRWTTVALEGRPLLRWRGRKREPWHPNELGLEIAEAIDPTSLLEELAKLYGPLELQILGRRRIIAASGPT